MPKAYFAHERRAGIRRTVVFLVSVAVLSVWYLRRPYQHLTVTIAGGVYEAYRQAWLEKRGIRTLTCVYKTGSLESISITPLGGEAQKLMFSNDHLAFERHITLCEQLRAAIP